MNDDDYGEEVRVSSDSLQSVPFEDSSKYLQEALSLGKETLLFYSLGAGINNVPRNVRLSFACSS